MYPNSTLMKGTSELCYCMLHHQSINDKCYRFPTREITQAVKCQWIKPIHDRIKPSRVELALSSKG